MPMSPVRGRQEKSGKWPTSATSAGHRFATSGTRAPRGAVRAGLSGREPARGPAHSHSAGPGGSALAPRRGPTSAHPGRHGQRRRGARNTRRRRRALTLKRAAARVARVRRHHGGRARRRRRRASPLAEPAALSGRCRCPALLAVAAALALLVNRRATRTTALPFGLALIVGTLLVLTIAPRRCEQREWLIRSVASSRSPVQVLGSTGYARRRRGCVRPWCRRGQASKRWCPECCCVPAGGNV